jgi:hypothetical protein
MKTYSADEVMRIAQAEAFKMLEGRLAGSDVAVACGPTVCFGGVFYQWLPALLDLKPGWRRVEGEA